VVYIACMANGSQQEPLFEKIRALSPEKRAELEDFVDFLRQRDEDRRLADAVTRASEGSFAKVWDNDSDADYDNL
jgi:hypothetical protein